ncbi:cysteine proteinase, partial [Daedalea quercina L-15889]
TTYSKAAKSELQGNFDEAFRLYVKAAEQFLHLKQISHDERQRLKCKDQATKALERAEKIKLARPELRPLARNHFATQEQLYVLRKSSFVNDIRFPLWDEDAAIKLDTGHPALSPDQQRNLAAWRKVENGRASLASSPLDPQDIVQHIVTDCSVCGSIAVCICHNRHFQTEIGWSSLHPVGSCQSAPEPNTDIYHVRLLFNGTYRRVTIDDKLPTYPDGSLMCLSTGNKQQIWPSLLEKAYMKLMGGYDFPGSDSCVDLHALTGWIPEHVNLKSSNSQRERLWTRIAQGFYNGSCMLTLGTGEKVESVPFNDITLLPVHCYAVIDVSSSLTERELTVLDSWIHTESLQLTKAAHASDMEPELSPGTFKLSWDAVCNFFDGVYLSWDPGIFEHQITFHGTWTAGSMSLRGEDKHSCHFQLQLRTRISEAQRGDEDIWVQLTRHISDMRRTSEYISLLVNGGDEPSRISPEINPLTLKGEYTNSIHNLVRSLLDRHILVLHIVAAYEGQRDDVGFTVTVYSNASISWLEEIPKALYHKEVDGVFSSTTAGGHHGYPSFMNNPQYHLRIYQGGSLQNHHSKKATISITLRGPRHIPVNVSLVYSKGERLTGFGHNESAANSGPYGFGYAHATRDLPVGDYTLILSTFEPQQLGSFKLRVESQLPIDLTPIPQEGAGMFKRVCEGAWTDKTAGGGPGSNRYVTNPRYEVQVDTATQLKVRLQLLDTIPPASINVSLFQLKDTRNLLVESSGPYSDGVAGVATPQVTLQPGTYHVVPSTYNPGLLRAFRLIFYSGTTVRISPVALT